MKNKLTELQLLSISITFCGVLGLILFALINNWNPLTLPGRVFLSYLTQSIVPLLFAAILAGLIRMFCQIKFLKLFTNCNFAIGTLVLLCILANSYTQNAPQNSIQTYKNTNNDETHLTNKRIENSYQFFNKSYVNAKLTTEQAKKTVPVWQCSPYEVNHSPECFVRLFNTEIARSMGDGAYLHASLIDVTKHKKTRIGVQVFYGYDSSKWISEGDALGTLNHLKKRLYPHYCPMLQQTSFPTIIVFALAYEGQVLGTSFLDWPLCSRNKDYW